jgi:hypothetical protein
MKKIFVSAMFLASVAVVSAQTGQTNASETKQKRTHMVHKKTTSTSSNNGMGVKMSTTKKHHGWTKGKHRGAAIKQTKTTTTTTTTPE